MKTTLLVPWLLAVFLIFALEIFSPIFGPAALGGYIWTDHSGKNHWCPPDCGPGGGTIIEDKPNIGGGDIRQKDPIRKKKKKGESRKERAHKAYNSGIDSYTSGNYDRAIAFFEEALKYDPSNAEIKENLRKAKAAKASMTGLQFYNKGDCKKAARHFREALTLWENEQAKENLRIAQECLQEMKQEEERQRQLGKLKEKINETLSSLSAGLYSSNTSSSDLDFLDSEGFSLSQGTQSSKTTELSFMEEGMPGIAPDQSEDDLPKDAVSGRRYALLKTVEVPSPSGYKTEQERRAQLAKLSNEQIDIEIARTRRILECMRNEFLEDPKVMERWLGEAQESEKKALKAGFHLILFGSLKKWKKQWKAYPRLKLFAENGLRYLSYEEPVKELSKDPLDQKANLEMARQLFLDLYSTLRDFDEGLISKKGPPIAHIANFLVEYSYQVCRWTLARGQVQAISDNLDNPKGKLQAQLSIKKVLEDLIEEKDRRKDRKKDNKRFEKE